MTHKPKSTPHAERRFLTTEFRVSPAGEPARIGGYAALFDARSADLGGFSEDIDSHAFDSILATKPDVRALFNHDPSAILGRTPTTLRLSADSRGLAYEVDLPDTQTARDLLVSMRRGDVTGSSFGFIVKRDQWTDNKDGSVSRRILEFDELLDVSPVTFPAYSATSVSLRSLPDTMPAELRARLTESRGDACECDCPECVDGNCADCSNDACSDPNCACGQRSVTKTRMEMRLRLRMMGL